MHGAKYLSEVATHPQPFFCIAALASVGQKYGEWPHGSSATAAKLASAS